MTALTLDQKLLSMEEFRIIQELKKEQLSENTQTYYNIELRKHLDAIARKDGEISNLESQNWRLQVKNSDLNQDLANLRHNLRHLKIALTIVLISSLPLLILLVVIAKK
ncbi:hypothetical protein UB23_00375 [Pseudomonas sp. ES3-33]|nr:hypothetical protein UB23_00375 [Pseudomonas sp. ES3-33]